MKKMPKEQELVLNDEMCEKKLEEAFDEYENNNIFKANIICDYIIENSKPNPYAWYIKLKILFEKIQKNDLYAEVGDYCNKILDSSSSAEDLNMFQKEIIEYIKIYAVASLKDDLDEYAKYSSHLIAERIIHKIAQINIHFLGIVKKCGEKPEKVFEPVSIAILASVINSWQNNVKPNYENNIFYSAKCFEKDVEDITKIIEVTINLSCYGTKKAVRFYEDIIRIQEESFIALGHKNSLSDEYKVKSYRKIKIWHESIKQINPKHKVPDFYNKFQF